MPSGTKIPSSTTGKPPKGFEEAPDWETVFRVADRWSAGIPDYALAAYRLARDRDRIRGVTLTLQRSTGYAVVEYDSPLPPAFIREELKTIRRKAQAEYEQTKLEHGV